MVIQLARLGDLIQSIPFLQTLKADSSNHLTLMLDSRIADSARDAVPADEIIPVDIKNLSRSYRTPDLYNNYLRILEGASVIGEMHYDRVYNLNHAMINYALLPLIRTEKLTGFQFSGKPDNVKCSPEFRLFFNQSQNRKYARIHLADIFKMLVPVSGDYKFPLWQVSEKGGGFAADLIAGIRRGGFEKVIGLHLGAGAEIRKWGAEKFARTVSLVRQKGSSAFVIVGTDTKESSRFKDSLGDTPGIYDLTGRTSIDQLAGVLQQCDLVISSDSGPLQLAAAVGTKSIGLYFISALIHETGPLGKGHIVIQSLPECGPCDEENPACDDLSCKEEITPELLCEVILLSETGGISDIIDPPANVLIFESDIDQRGQVYRLKAGNAELDKGSFYRELWFRLHEADAQDVNKTIRQNPDYSELETEIRNLSKQPDLLPLAHHYFYVKADEGPAAAAGEFFRVLKILENINGAPIIKYGNTVKSA